MNPAESTSAAVSAVLLSYNCEDFIEEALLSLLAQDFRPMEIVISDDASTDGTLAVLEKTLAEHAGSRTYTLRRRSRNSGSKSAHLNDVLPETSGDVIVFFDGDDISAPDRVRRIFDAFMAHPTLKAVYSGYSLIDAEGRDLGRGVVPHPDPAADAAAWFAEVDAYASGGTLAIARSVLERFGSLVPEVNEDIVLPFRASLLGEVRYLDQSLVRVRRHGGGMTQDVDVYGSLESYRARYLQGVAKARERRDSRLADIATAVALMPERGADLAVIREIVAASMQRAEKSAGLVSPSLLTRLKTLLDLRLSGKRRDNLLRDAALVFAPAAYVRYKRRALHATPAPKTGAA